MVITDWNICSYCLRVHPGRICAEEIKAADRAPPEAKFDNVEAMLAYLDDEPKR